MECRVHSPCGHFVVALTDESGLVRLTVIQHRRPNLPAEYVALLTPKLVEQITTDAGVVKSVDVFLKMLHTALIGSSESLTFAVCTLAEASERLRTDPGSAPPQPISSTFMSQLILLLEYAVPYTRAWYPIPLQPKPGAGVPSAHAVAHIAPAPPPPLPPLLSTSSPSPSPNARQPSTPQTLPKVVLGSPADDDDLIREVKRLKSENAGLRSAGEKVLREMKQDIGRLERDLLRARKAQEELSQCQSELARTKEELRRYKDRVRDLERPRPNGNRSGGPRRFDTPPSQRPPSERATRSPFRSPRGRYGDDRSSASSRSGSAYRSPMRTTSDGQRRSSPGRAWR